MAASRIFNGLAHIAREDSQSSRGQRTCLREQGRHNGGRAHHRGMFRPLLALSILLTELGLGALAKPDDVHASYSTPPAGYNWVMSNPSNQPEVFLVGQDQHLYHAWCCWSGWNQLPGTTLIPGVSVGNDADGRMEAFAVGTNGEMWHVWQTCTTCGWSNLYSMGSIGGGFNNKVPKVALNSDGRLEIFAIANDCQMYHAFQGAPNGGFSQWYSLGGCWSDGLSVDQNADGRLEILAVGQNHSLYHRWQNSPGGSWYGSWAFEGGAWGADCPPGGQCGGNNASCFPQPNQAVPGLAINASGELEAQVPAYVPRCAGGFGDVFHKTQTSAGGGFGNWTYLGGQFGCAYGNPKPFRWPDGHLESFEDTAVNCNGQPYMHTWEQGCTGCWSGWLGLNMSNDAADMPGGVVNSQGNLELFFLSQSGGDLRHIWYSGGWTNPQSLGGSWNDF